MNGPEARSPTHCCLAVEGAPSCTGSSVAMFKLTVQLVWWMHRSPCSSFTACTVAVPISVIPDLLLGFISLSAGSLQASLDTLVPTMQRTQTFPMQRIYTPTGSSCSTQLLGICSLKTDLEFNSRHLELHLSAFQLFHIKGEVRPKLIWLCPCCESQECNLFCAPVTRFQQAAG